MCTAGSLRGHPLVHLHVAGDRGGEKRPLRMWPVESPQPNDPGRSTWTAPNVELGWLSTPNPRQALCVPHLHAMPRPVPRCERRPARGRVPGEGVAVSASPRRPSPEGARHSPLQRSKGACASADLAGGAAVGVGRCACCPRKASGPPLALAGQPEQNDSSRGRRAGVISSTPPPGIFLQLVETGFRSRRRRWLYITIYTSWSLVSVLQVSFLLAGGFPLCCFPPLVWCFPLWLCGGGPPLRFFCSALQLALMTLHAAPSGGSASDD